MNTLKKALVKTTEEAHLSVKNIAKTAKKIETEFLNFNLQWPPKSI